MVFKDLPNSLYWAKELEHNMTIVSDRRKKAFFILVLYLIVNDLVIFKMKNQKRVT